MPFFYFDVINEEVLTEDQGFELTSLAAAKVEAAGYLVEAARSHLKPDQVSQQIKCAVKDENQKTVLRLRLILEIDTL